MSRDCVARARGEDCGICDWLTSAQGEHVAVESGPFVELPLQPVVQGPPLPEPIPGYQRACHVVLGPGEALPFSGFTLGPPGERRLSGPLVDAEIARALAEKAAELRGLAENQQRTADTMRVCGYPADALVLEGKAAAYRRAADIVSPATADTDKPPPATQPSGTR